MSPWWIAALPALTAMMTTVNLLTWPRGRPAAAPARTSILIPARDEIAGIEACVRAAAAVGPMEVVVYDDGSTDGTAHVLARLAAELPILRVVRGDGLPAGWVGKVHACHRLAEEAHGDTYWFVDADVVLHPGALERLGGLFTGWDADLVTAMPHQQMGSTVERLVLPWLLVTYLSWFPLVLVRMSPWTSFLAANGQLLAIRREGYARFGGFAAVRSAIVDDMAIARLAKRTGHRVLFADGFELASCRMYRSAAEVVAGFSKNLFAGLGPVGTVVAGTLYVATFTAPFLVLAMSPWLGGGPAALAAVALLMASRAALVFRYDHPPSSVVLHPISLALVVGIAMNSWRWHLRGRITWRGRSYRPGLTP